MVANDPFTNSADSVNASISQIGDIPGDAISIRLKARSADLSGRGVFSVSLDGMAIPLLPLGSGANYILYGGDVSAWQGRTAELRVAAELNPNVPHPALGFTFLWFDSISFSPQAVPEASTWTLAGLAALTLGGLFLRRRGCAQRGPYSR